MKAETAPRRVALLVNPSSGKGRGDHAGVVAERWLRERGATVEVFEGSTPEQTRSLAGRAVAAAPDVLVVVGGDGTLSGILDIVIGSDVPVVVVPAGTGNDLARALGIPRDQPKAAAEAALTGTARKIDVGTITVAEHEHLFLTVAALGFDAKVSDRTNRLRRPRGRMRYYLAIVIELARLAATEFRVSFDGEPGKARPGTLMAIGSTSSYGGGMPICAAAVPDDGLLDVVHIAPMRRLTLIRLFPLLLRGTHLGREEVTTLRVRSVAVSAPDLVVYADGERIGEGECVIGVREGALTMMVPEG